MVSHSSAPGANTGKHSNVPSPSRPFHLTGGCPLPRPRFHEDGFTSSLQTVSNHLGATAPFPIRSAHRSSPSFTASAITFLTLDIAESIRRLLLWPFGMFAWAVVVGLSLLLQVLHVLGGGDAKKGFVSNVRREIETIRSFWVDDSAAEVKDSKKRD